LTGGVSAPYSWPPELPRELKRVKLQPRIFLHRLLLAAALPATAVSLIIPAARGVDTRTQDLHDIPPPFGLRWGEDMTRMEKLLKGANAKVVDKSDMDGRAAWTVEGILQANLKRSVFYFSKGSLVEVELQYQGDAWDAAAYDNFMSDIRRKIESKFGTGQLISRSKKPEGEVMQTLVGYKWNQNNTSVELFYFSAEGANQAYRTVSVHYKIQE
jgi:hypothetical protein